MRIKAQITLFMIVGIVLLFIFGFVVYVTTQIIHSESDGNTNEQGSTAIEANRVKFFITDCLKSSTKEALRVIALQGGVLYDSQIDDGAHHFSHPFHQYGIHYLPYEFKGEIYNVSYALTRLDEPNCHSLSPPAYFKCPGVDRPLDEGISDVFPFGRYPNSEVHDLPPLCEINGSNHRLLSGAAFSCGDSYGDGNTVQGFLESFIKKKTLACIDEGRKEGVFELNVTFAKERNTTSTVMFGEGDVAAILDMPIKVSLLDDTDVKFESFVVRLPVRFKQLYEFAEHLLLEEARNIYHNLRKAGDPGHSTLMGCLDFVAARNERDKVVNCYRDGFEVTYIPHACNYTADEYGLNLCKNSAEHESFLVLEDNKSLAIGNEPFKLVLAIGNRAPVMDKVRYWYYNDTDNYWRYLQTYYHTNPVIIYNRTSAPLDPNSTEHEIVADFDSTISIIPYAIDPDEDNDPYGASVMYSVFHYEGWLANSTYNAWEDSGAYLDGLPYFSPHTPEKKDANVSMKDEYVGEHTLTVYTEDVDGNRVSDVIDIKVRCRDRRRGHGDGVVQTAFDSIDYIGDYDYSNLADPDQNNSNDCCNESANYTWNTPGHTCGICRRCNGSSGCEVNITAGNAGWDCPMCFSCDGSSNDYKNYLDACRINNSPDISIDDRCATSYGGDGVCCQGTCFDSSDPAKLDEFSYSGYDAHSMNQSDPWCWTQTPSCFTPTTPGAVYYSELVGNYTFHPLPDGTYVPSQGCYCEEWGECT